MQERRRLSTWTAGARTVDIPEQVLDTRAPGNLKDHSVRLIKLCVRKACLRGRKLAYMSLISRPADAKVSTVSSKPLGFQGTKDATRTCLPLHQL